MNDDNRMDPQHSHAAVSDALRREEPEPVGTASTPEAVQEASVSRAAAKKKLAQVRGRGVDWLRPSELFAQGGGTLSRRGIDASTLAHQRMRRPFEAGVQVVTDRARRLPPVTAFGRRGSRQDGPVRSGVGMR